MNTVGNNTLGAYAAFAICSKLEETIEGLLLAETDIENVFDATNET